MKRGALVQVISHHLNDFATLKHSHCENSFLLSTIPLLLPKLSDKNSMNVKKKKEKRKVINLNNGVHNF